MSLPLLEGFKKRSGLSCACLALALAGCTAGSVSDPSTVDADALRPRCGDGVCHSRERCSTCPADCGACAGIDSGSSSGADGGSTTADSGGSTCGNGACDPGEDCARCAGDCMCSPPPSGGWLWHGDADTAGLAAWHGLESPDADDLTVVSDPDGRYGRVYRAQLEYGERTSDGKARSELYGAERPDDIEIVGVDAAHVDHARGRYDDLYYGWRTRVNEGINAPVSRANSGNLLQFKGDADCGGPAVGLTIKYGRLTLRTEIDYGLPDNILWNGPAVSGFAGAWHDLVVHVHYSFGSDGFVEAWVDGVPQTMVNGARRIDVPTMCPGDTRVYLKMGLYRSTDLERPGITDYHWIESPRVGTSYDAVVPR